MKIIAIKASHRGDKGRTRFLLNKLFQGAMAVGAECEVITLANLKINRCAACGHCHTEEHHLQCVYQGMAKIPLTNLLLIRPNKSQTVYTRRQ
jgi:multimeric flavodoxin WrbA